MKTDWPVAPRSAFELPPKGGVASVQETDPASIRRDLTPAYGPEVAQLVADQVAAQLKARGIDQIDRRYLATPDMRAGIAPGHVPGSGFRYTAGDVRQYRRYQEGTEPWFRKMDLMSAYFRAILFGNSLSESLGESMGDEHFVRALSSTDSAGGFLIPPGFIPELLKDVPKLSQLFQYVRKYPVNVPTGSMPKVTTNAQVYWGTEGTPLSDEGTDPAFAHVTYALNRMNALVKMSREIANDSNPDIVASVTGLFQESVAVENDRVIAVGTGTGQPTGLYSSTAITDTSGITTLTYQNLLKLKESVDQRYHNDPSFRWVFNQNVKAAIFGILDTLNRPIFREATGNEPATILNTPFSIEAAMPNNCIVIGALRYYVWFQGQDLTIERTTEGGDSFLNHEMWIKFIQRSDGKPVSVPHSPWARTRVLTGVTNLTSFSY